MCEREREGEREREREEEERGSERLIFADTFSFFVQRSDRHGCV